MNRLPVSPRLVIGSCLVVAAGLLLLDNAGLFEFGRVWHWWPVVVIGLGLMQSVCSQGFRPRLGGLVLTLIGALFLAANLWPETLNGRQAWGYVWPLLILLIGVSMMTRRGAGRAAGSDRVSGFAMMSGQSLKNTSAAFSGGELTSIMGGYELDLRDARMVEGETVIEIFALMGGFEIRIPEDWVLQSEVVSIMGGIENATHPVATATHTLRLRGFVMMGGVEVRN